MGKSLALSGNGLSFGKFMKALIHVPKEEIDQAMESDKKKRKLNKEKRPLRGRERAHNNARELLRT
jgi:hypothetical protein